MTPYLGEIRMFAGNYAPQNWKICDGSVLRIADYQALFALLGTAWGGDGTSTFCIPNLKGRLPVGQGRGAGLTARTLGQSGGADVVQLAAAEVPQHTHALYASANPATAVRPDPSLVYAQAQGGDLFYTTDANAALNANTVTATGGAAAHANQMPSQSVNYIICISGGMFPTRD